MTSQPLTHKLFDRLTAGSGEGGLSEQAAREEPANFMRHAGALSMNKLADGLLDPKLVLSWLMGALGSPAALVALLVPVREAGALLPQLFTAPRIRAMGRRKWAWAWAAVAQGVAAAVMVVAALSLPPAAAGGAIVLALAVLALARSVGSVAYKDVLGKTVGQSRRGTVTGLAGSIAAGGVILFALVLMTGALERFTLVIGAIVLSAVFWIASGLLFSTVTEDDAPGAPEEGTGLGLLALLWRDPDLGRFVLARCLLLPTALAPPWLVLMASAAGDARFSALGAMVLASALATLLSAYVWGRLSDRSSRLVLVFTGAVAAGFLLVAVGLDRAGLMGSAWAAPLALFGVMIAYQGVRMGRSTYLVDMAPKDQRAAYTAVSNTTVGVVLLLAGAGSAGLAGFGPQVVLVVFAGLCLLASVVAWGLRELGQ